ncbi:Putative ADP-ribosylation factor GTPase-activating protein AGD9 [Durusdinium trenchii]|uniref:ADP-ribosylation factor GTPase-activating protein AGD9 n=1 Tax=Durusdinium trenchii TaxID=1381693 RepID=A0ABP0JVZ6_9DINO
MVQMAAGGNGKALEYFKSNEMGKLSSSGRPVDYTSKVAQRYKAQMDTEAKKLCEKYSVAAKAAKPAEVHLAKPEEDFGFDVPTKATGRGATAGWAEIPLVGFEDDGEDPTGNTRRRSPCQS